MRLAVLTGESGGGWHGDDLLRAARAAGHDVVTCWWEALRGDVGQSQKMQGGGVSSGRVRLSDLDAVIARAMPAATLEQVVFRMDALHRVQAAGTVVINPPRAIEMAVDKYLALATAAASGIDVPPTVVCQRAIDAKRAFHELGGDVVLKPIFGSEGFGLTRISDEAMAQRAFAQLQRMGSAIYLQKFVPHEAGDYRLFVIEGKVIAAMRRTSEDWRTNVARGGKAEAIEPPADLVELATGACRACGVDVGGVDIVRDADGRPLLLEINAAPGWRRLASVTGVDVAASLVGFVDARVRRAAEHRAQAGELGAAS